MHRDEALRHDLVALLTDRRAHMDFEDAVAGFPLEAINSRPPNCDYSFWHLLEHMRIAQQDIVEYITAETYTWPDFPDDLWPDKSLEVGEEAWQTTIGRFLADRERLANIVRDTSHDLFAPLANSGAYQHTIVREIQVIAAHNSYHIGELGILRQLMGLWP